MKENQVIEKNTPKKNKYRIFNIIFYVILAIVAIYAVIALTSTSDGAHSIFGRSAYTVQTNSMYDTFEKGDLIYVNTDFEFSEIQANVDVITYKALIDVNGDGQAEWVYNSHRVYSVEEDTNGNYHFITKGDANSDVDPYIVNQSDIVGVWTGQVTKNIGGVIDGVVGFLKSSTGFFVFIVVPTFAFLAYEVYRFIGVMTEYKLEQASANKGAISEEALAAARAILEQEAKEKAEKEKQEQEDKE
ncbi:MAG: signal peptidase I [Bacilli bacterium]|nr:signal peptidase I [Bacilli bacterium]MBN2876233.1 signal peptidase I [Bacilli bacterium]